MCSGGRSSHDMLHKMLNYVHTQAGLYWQMSFKPNGLERVCRKMHLLSSSAQFAVIAVECVVCVQGSTSPDTLHVMSTTKSGAPGTETCTHAIASHADMSKKSIFSFWECGL